MTCNGCGRLPEGSGADTCQVVPQNAQQHPLPLCHSPPSGPAAAPIELRPSLDNTVLLVR